MSLSSYVRSPLFAGLPHAFGTRDEARAGLASLPLLLVRQVHGAIVADAARLLDRATQGEPPPAADAIVCPPDVRAAIGVLTADCVPILFADRGGGAVAVAHAGWRGTVLDVAGETVRSLSAVGARPQNIVCALGPSLCLTCFEVGEEVAAAFITAGLTAAVTRRPSWPRPHVDLAAANRQLLRAAGLADRAIDAAPPCTRCDPLRFFSYRRDGAGCGHQLSLIAPRGRLERA